MTDEAYRERPSTLIDVKDEVATLTVLPVSMWEERYGITPEMRSTLDRWWENHSDLAAALAEVRDREDVRVIVITGGKDDCFAVNAVSDGDWERMRMPSDTPWPFVPGWSFRQFKGIIQHHETAVACEKPIIAKVNGDAIGGGLMMALSCDIIAAVDDAIVMDSHMALDDWPAEYAPDISRFSPRADPARAVVPGDGGVALVPLYLTPTRAKEFLILGRPYTSVEFERMGVFNYAVPRAELDGLVDDLCRRIISRPPEHVAMTKRLANRSVAHHLNMTLDAAAYAEWVGLPSIGGARGERWTDRRYTEKWSPKGP
jgi:enoyl-CoA hydratase/carnithine racemase